MSSVFGIASYLDTLRTCLCGNIKQVRKRHRGARDLCAHLCFYFYLWRGVGLIIAAVVGPWVTFIVVAAIACASKPNKFQKGHPCSMSNYKIPIEIVNLFGPFIEFKQNGAIVSVELESGQIISQVLLIYPNEVLAAQGCKEIF